MAGIYAADGSWNVTVVDGLSLTGATAADGSRNVIVPTGGGIKGAYHKCGAWYVTTAPSGIVPMRAPDGSMYVSVSPYTTGGQRVTVVSGSL